MPAGRPQQQEQGAKPSGAAGPKRPPWVRESPPGLPMPTAPWTLNKRGSVSKEGEVSVAEVLPPRKTSTVKIIPSVPSENGTPKDPHTFERPKLREVSKASPKEATKLQSREVKVPITVTSTRRDSRELPAKLHIEATSKKREEKEEPKREEPRKIQIETSSRRRQSDDDSPPRRRDEGLPKVELKPVVIEPKKKEEVKLPKVELKPVPQKEDIDKAIPAERNAIVRQESLKKVCPAPPPMPPPPPPPELPFNKRDPLSRNQIEKLDTLRSRPRKRPDWGAMMKEVESGKKLRHVQCNDRSQPLLPENKAKGQFIYESETANLHNQLLKQIQTGANLKHVKTNDRSKPVLQGLRKFRRQMTIEEQIQKSQSMANMPEAEVEEEDEMDDIDKVRDDLQSTKQMLALELRNKEAQIRENKRLLSRLQSLEAELEKMREEVDENPTKASPSSPAADEKVVKNLKEEVITAKKNAEHMEKKYHDTADQLDVTKTELDEVKRQNQLLEKKLQQASQGGVLKRQSISDRKDSVVKPPESEEEEFEPESEESEGEEDTEEKKQRRAEREVRLIRNKLKSLKNKQEAAKRERQNLREQMKKNQQAMKQEKKKFKSLQKEVNKMAAMMKDDEEENEEDLDEEEAEEEEETEEETESESESESSEDDDDSSESEDEDIPIEKQKENVQIRVKRHENCLNALKKGNYMLKANVDRLQDDLSKQKESVQSLQEDLDSVLAELE